MFCVYKHTAPNGKVYIGITSKNPLYRWQNGHGYRNNKRFTNAILKYGWDNFKHEILFADLSKQEACEIEMRLIKEYRSTEIEHGYNVSTGGECAAAGVVWPEEHKKKTSQSLKGHAVSNETKEKIKLARKHQKNVCNPKPNFGSKNNKSRKVKQIDAYGNIMRVFETVSEAAKSNGVCHQSISDCCTGRIKSVKGFKFEYC